LPPETPSEHLKSRLYLAASSIDLSVVVTTTHPYRTVSQAENIVLDLRKVMDSNLKRLDQRIYKKSNVSRLAESKRTQYFFQYEDQRKHRSKHRLPCYIHFHGFVAFGKNDLPLEHIHRCWKRTAMNIRTELIKNGLVSNDKIGTNSSSFQYSRVTPEHLFPRTFLGKNRAGLIAYNSKQSNFHFGWSDDFSQYHPEYKHIGYSFGFGEMFLGPKKTLKKKRSKKRRTI